jgi:hypothetical protein
MVQAAKVQKIREGWIADGKPYCAHENYDKEYFFGAQSEDYACLNCGITWPRNDPVPPPEPSDEA